MRLSSVFALLALGCSPAPSIPADAHVAAGDCDVDHLEACEYRPVNLDVGELEGYVVQDEVVERPDSIVIRHPVATGHAYPIVIYSRGGDLADSGQHTGEEWGNAIASAGYVFIHVEHPRASPQQTRDLCELARVPEAECTADLQIAQIAKPRDLVALLDELPEIAAHLESMRGVRMDLTRVITMGHSSGSRPGLLLAGAVIVLSPSVPRFSMPDPRPIADIALSPQGPGFAGFFEEPTGETSCDAITRPVLVMTGDNDINQGNPGLLGSIRREVWEDLPGGNGDQYLFYSHLPEGVGGHSSYNLHVTDSSDARLIGLNRALGSVARAFIDRIVGDAGALAYLESDRARVLAGLEITELLVK